ncbi:MAG: carboxylating nicotinate-nucleotide diphosphorylase [Isosphaeraceae bacterium]
MPTPVFDFAEIQNAETLIELAFAEDLGERGDLTSQATIPEHARGFARFVVRSAGILAGLALVPQVVRRFGPDLEFRPLSSDGSRVEAATSVATISGSMRAVLSMERTALNFLQRLSGIATLTRQFVAEVEGTGAIILDTRKTHPGWRALEKYAVRCGGGTNHRLGLHDAVLIKDNHLAWLAHDADPIRSAVSAARTFTPAGTVVEVEVDSLEQLDQALQCSPDLILIDNIGPDGLAEAVRRRDAQAPAVKLEASGSVRLETVRILARTGVDRISVGALTHSAPALDIGLDFDRWLPP